MKATKRNNLVAALHSAELLCRSGRQTTLFGAPEVSVYPNNGSQSDVGGESLFFDTYITVLIRLP